MQKNIKNKIAKIITEQRLQNIALHYIERFGGTEKTLRDVLIRRVQNSMTDHPEQDIDVIKTWIDSIVKKAIDLGYINDSYFAKMRVMSLARRGDSKKMITMKLKQKGITDIDLEKAFTELSDDSEFLSALAYVNKRKFGVNGVKDISDPDILRRQLASLARRGFSFNIAQKALFEK